MFRTLLTLLLVLLASPTTWATATTSVAEGAFDDGDPRVVAELLTDHAAVAPGQPFRVGVRVTADPDWHIYWMNAGEGGLSTDLQFGGVTAGPLQWPAPHVFVDPSGQITTYGYADETLLFANATAPKGDEARVSATIDFLVCKVDCIPGRLNLQQSVPLSADAETANRELFDTYAAEVPPLFAGAKAVWNGQREVLLQVEGVVARAPSLPAEQCPGGQGGWCGSTAHVFLPASNKPVAWQTVRVATLEHRSELALRASEDLTDANLPKRMRGVLWLREPDGVRPVTIDAAVTRSAAASTTPHRADAKEASIWWTLLLALLGGMILNLMPCVFPVLALKVAAFVELAGVRRRVVATHALAYTGGIVGSMLTLAAVVVAIRAGGTAVGWGFQFQNPVFVSVMVGVLVAFAMNLFGVFEVTVALNGRVEDGPSLRRSAGEGVLAVLLATPCSAPLLGTAVGFALAADTATILLIFAMIGIGLALPFVVLSLVPGLRERMPAPGPWMKWLKLALGGALLATASWLVWLLFQTGGLDAVVRVCIFAAIVAIAAALYGRLQFRVPRRAALACAAVIGLTAVAMLRFENPKVTHEVFSEAQVATALDRGNVVFVDFTADWCITCKVNERTVLQSAEIEALFEQQNVAVIVGDWTQRDDRILQILQRHGKGGVPLYLVYSPHRPEKPEVLPELLTAGIVRDAVVAATTP